MQMAKMASYGLVTVISAAISLLATPSQAQSGGQFSDVQMLAEGDGIKTTLSFKIVAVPVYYIDMTFVATPATSASFGSKALSALRTAKPSFSPLDSSSRPTRVSTIGPFKQQVGVRNVFVYRTTMKENPGSWRSMKVNWTPVAESSAAPSASTSSAQPKKVDPPKEEPQENQEQGSDE